MEQQTNPLILVFYIDRETISNDAIRQQLVASVNHIIEVKKMNALAFFMPTDGEERIECINPAIATQEEMDRINKLVTELETQFSVGEKLAEADDLESDDTEVQN